MRRPGFTLLELATVIAVMAVLMAVVGGPTLAYVDTQRTRFAAARIAADLAYCQRYAMSSRLRSWTTFDVANNRYTLYVESATNPGKANRVAMTQPLTGSTQPVQLGSGEYRNATLTSVSVNGTTEIEFDSFGKPHDGNSAALTVDAGIALNNGVSLTLRAVSGLVEQAG